MSRIEEIRAKVSDYKLYENSTLPNRDYQLYQAKEALRKNAWLDTSFLLSELDRKDAKIATLQSESLTGVELAELHITFKRLQDENERLTTELSHYRQAEADGLLVRLPCRVGGTVYTVDQDYFPCATCKEMGRTNIVKCYRLNSTRPYTDAPYECPVVYEINARICNGFTVSAGKDGNPEASLAGEWGYEGLEKFSGIDGKQYYAREEAEQAAKEAAQKEADDGTSKLE